MSEITSVLWVETTEETPSLNTTNQGTSADVQPISKNTNPTMNKREDKETSSPASKEPPIPNL